MGHIRQKRIGLSVLLLFFLASLTILPVNALALDSKTNTLTDSIARVMPYDKTYVGSFTVQTDDGMANATIRVEVDATVNAQNGLIISINGSRCLISSSINLDSWDLDSLSVSRDSSNVYARVRGTAKFSWVLPVVGTRVYGEKYVDRTLTWPIE